MGLLQLGKFLASRGRSRYLRQYQYVPSKLTALDGTDYAGRERARKSTRGGLGLQPVLRDVEVTSSITLKSDASAAMPFARRRGLGNVRRLAARQL